MKFKAMFALLIPVFAALLFAQFNLVNASNSITSPVTFPQVTPTPTPTPPVTFPQPTPVVTPTPAPNEEVKYKVSGKVSYLYNGWLRLPARAQVQLNGVGSNYKIYTSTDALGNYQFKVRANTYELRAQDRLGTKFSPNPAVVRVNSNISGVNFVGSKTLW